MGDTSKIEAGEGGRTDVEQMHRASVHAAALFDVPPYQLVERNGRVNPTVADALRVAIAACSRVGIRSEPIGVFFNRNRSMVSKLKGKLHSNLEPMVEELVRILESTTTQDEEAR